MAEREESPSQNLDAFPRGVILPWYAKSGEFPGGWAVCDGTNGTPDLRDRFLIGVSDMAEVGKSVGKNEHSHTFTGRTNTCRANPDPKAIGAQKRGSTSVAGLDHSHPLSGATVSESHIPPSVTVLYMMKL